MFNTCLKLKTTDYSPDLNFAQKFNNTNPTC